MNMETITMKIDAAINPILSDQMLRAWNNLFEASLVRDLTLIESSMLACLGENIIFCSKFLALYANNQNE
jgi:hypothetical protein